MIVIRFFIYSAASAFIGLFLSFIFCLSHKNNVIRTLSKKTTERQGVEK